MKTNALVCGFIFFLALVCLIASKSQPEPIQESVIQPEPAKSEPAPEPEIIKIEPVWTNWPAVRSYQKGCKVLQDIESHLPNGHIYDGGDVITNAHECTHGINSNVRNKFGGTMGRVNAFYCLENKACVIKEPNNTIRNVAQMVPQSLRGQTYNLYLVKQAGAWNNTSLYLLDEWVAYTNGTHCWYDMNQSMEAAHGTVEFTFEFNVYCLTLAQAIKKYDSGYDDKQFKAFMMWNLERSFAISRNHPQAMAYWAKFQKNSDAAALRTFTKSYFGAEWCQKILDI